jgi:hypothetical protein
MKKRKWIVCAVVLFIGLVTAHGQRFDKKGVLFPKREYIKKHSIKFFKNVNLTFPLISRVDFFVRSKAYRSAYINLSEVISKNRYLGEIMPRFEENNRELIDMFNEKYKKELRLEIYPLWLGEKKVSKIKFHLLLIYSIYNDYLNSKLSGDNAFKLWNFFLKMTEAAYKDKEKTAERAAILSLSSHFVFFKKAKKWQKKAGKILRKLSASSFDDPDIALVLGKG